MAPVLPEGKGDPIREEFLLGSVGGLVVIAPARRAGDLGSNPSPGENFSLILLIIRIYYFWGETLLLGIIFNENFILCGESCHIEVG